MTPAEIKTQLGGLAGLHAKTQAADADIRRRAQERLAIVDAKLKELRPQALLHPEAEQHYLDLQTERGRLVRVLA